MSADHYHQDLEALGWMSDVAEALLHLHNLPEPVVHRVSAWV